MKSLISKLNTPLIQIIVIAITNAIFCMIILKNTPVLLALGDMRKVLLGISVMVLPMLVICYLLLTYQTYQRNSNLSYTKLLKIILPIISLVVILFSIGLGMVDSFYYPNYLYSKYFIYLPAVQIYAIFHFIVISIISKYLLNSRADANKNSGINISLSVVLSMLIIVATFMTISKYPEMLRNEYHIFVNWVLPAPEYRKDEVRDLGGFYRIMNFIEAKVPTDAAVIIPPQSNEYPLIGNHALVNYFLYPRDLVSIQKLDEYLEHNPESKLFFVIHKDSTDPHKYFPTMDMSAVKVNLLMEDNSSIEFNDVMFNKSLIEDNFGFLIGVMQKK